MHIESRIVIYNEQGEAVHGMASASQSFDLPENPKLADISDVANHINDNASRLYQGFVESSNNIPSVAQGKTTQPVDRQHFMQLLSMIDASKLRVLEAFSTNRTPEDQTTWWCVKIGPVK